MYRHNLVTVKLPMYTELLSASYMPEIKPIKVLQILAGMVELVDTLASGASERKLVVVQILFSVPFILLQLVCITNLLTYCI